MSSRDEAWALDMLIAARRALEFTHGMESNGFMSDEKTKAAVVRQIEIMGEAAKRVSDDYRNDHPEVPWRAAAGMRDFLIHEYDRVDYPKVWETVQKDLPHLIGAIEPLIPPENE